MIFLLLFTIFGSSSAISIQCTFTKDFDWVIIGKVYTCNVKECEFDGIKWLLDVEGKHMSGLANKDVQMIYFYNCPLLAFIPQKIHHAFPKFIGLKFEHTSINILNGDELNEYEFLEWFNIENQKIKHIPGNLFSNNPNLQRIGFTNNQISSIGEELLKTLKNGVTRHVSFEKNYCIDMNAETPEEITSIVHTIWKNCVSLLILQAQYDSIYEQHSSLNEKFDCLIYKIVGSCKKDVCNLP